MMFDIFKKKYNVLVIGCNGMLGKELSAFLKDKAAEGRNINVVTCLDYPEIDISDYMSLDFKLTNSVHYDYIINCAAITDTRGIEGELKMKSYDINALGVKNITKIARHLKSKLIHISTDYVFSEETGDYPKDINSIPFPVNTYGMHKLLAEQFIRTEMDIRDYSIIRASWLYGKYNEKSFVHKFLRNCFTRLEQQSYEVDCTCDEFSVPTSCTALCRKIYNTIVYDLSGTFHGNDLPNSTKFEVSRHEFCKEILTNAKAILKDKNFNKLECKPIYTTANSIMRYPKYSAMIPTHEKHFIEGTKDWSYHLQWFMKDEYFVKWLMQQ